MYKSFDFLNGPWTRKVFWRGTGPAVIIIHEIPGLNPLVVRFADRIADAGMTVYLPSLFRQPGRPASGAVTSMRGGRLDRATSHGGDTGSLSLEFIADRAKQRQEAPDLLVSPWRFRVHPV